MTTLKLGDTVTLTDHLVRCRVQSYLADAAIEAAGIASPRALKGRYTQTLWVPASFARAHLLRGLSVKSGTTDIDSATGIVVRRANLQQGFAVIGSWGEPTQWLQIGSTPAYFIATDINRLPIPARPDMIKGD